MLIIIILKFSSFVLELKSVMKSNKAPALSKEIADLKYTGKLSHLSNELKI